MADQQQQVKNLFHVAYPGVKCRIERETVASPSFLYQDGPPLQDVQGLLGSFHLPVVRAINAKALQRARTINASLFTSMLGTIA